MVTLFKYTILATFALAVYTIWVTSFTVGFGVLLSEEVLPSGNLPGTPNVPFKDRYTGITLLDYIFAGFALFYWPIFNGVTPSLQVLFTALWGMMGTSFVFVLLEECRMKQFGQWIKRMILLLTLNMGAGLAVVLPVYFALSIPAQPHHDDSLLSSNFIFVEKILPYMSLVFIPIALLLYLPAPTIVSYDVKQQLFVLFQFIPAILGILFWLQKGFQRPCRGSAAALKSTKKLLYVYVLVWGAIAQLQAVLPSLAVSLGFESFYPADGYNDLLGMFIPRLPWDPPANTNESVLIQAQWDYLLGGVAIWLWGTALNIQGKQLAKKPISYIWTLVKGLVLSLVVSPSGATALLLWERDEVVYRYIGKGKDY